jgi:hypothetical protein
MIGSPTLFLSSSASSPRGGPGPGRAVGFLLLRLLLLTLPCLLPRSSRSFAGAVAAADAFDRDVASPARYDASYSSSSSSLLPLQPPGLAVPRALTAAAVAGLPEPRRSLPVTTFVFSGDTTDAAESSGNLFSDCQTWVRCINDCRSDFFKVTGGNGGKITASTCGTASFEQRTYVWKGGSAACSSFTCTGTFDLNHFVLRRGCGCRAGGRYWGALSLARRYRVTCSCECGGLWC